MQHEHDHGQHRRAHHDRHGHPRDPLPGPEEQLPPPRRVPARGQDHDLGVGDHALHVEEVLRGVFRRPHEEVLDVVVRPAQPEEGIGRQEGVVGRLGQLADWVHGVCEGDAMEGEQRVTDLERRLDGLMCPRRYT